jgi:hypothetical protein
MPLTQHRHTGTAHYHATSMLQLRPSARCLYGTCWHVSLTSAPHPHAHMPTCPHAHMPTCPHATTTCQESIVHWRAKLASSAKEWEERNKALKAEKEIMTRHYAALKAAMDSSRAQQVGKPARLDAAASQQQEVAHMMRRHWLTAHRAGKQQVATSSGSSHCRTGLADGALFVVAPSASHLLCTCLQPSHPCLVQPASKPQVQARSPSAAAAAAAGGAAARSVRG